MFSFSIMILGFIIAAYELIYFMIDLFSNTWPSDNFLPFAISPYLIVLIFIASFIIGQIEYKLNSQNTRAKLAAKISGIVGLVILIIIIAIVFLLMELLSVSMD